MGIGSANRPAGLARRSSATTLPVMAKLVLTAIGDDRSGLVSALAGVVAEHGGNWLESRMARLGGKFAGIVLIEAPGLGVAALEEALTKLADGGLLEVSVSRTDAGDEADGAVVSLHLLGHDHPGIVAQVTQALARQGVTIDELTTQTLEAPMAGGVLFEADALVRIPAESDADAVRSALEALAGELMVDLELTEG